MIAYACLCCSVLQRALPFNYHGMQGQPSYLVIQIIRLSTQISTYIYIYISLSLSLSVHVQLYFSLNYFSLCLQMWSFKCLCICSSVYIFSLSKSLLHRTLTSKAKHPSNPLQQPFQASFDETLQPKALHPQLSTLNPKTLHPEANGLNETLYLQSLTLSSWPK